MNFALMQYHKYSLDNLEDMIPFEREIYIAMLAQYLEEEKQRIESRN
jgi:sensor histidine kinase YesM